MEWLYVGGALAAGFVLGALVILLVRRSPSDVIEYEVIEEESIPEPVPPRPAPPPEPQPDHVWAPPPRPEPQPQYQRPAPPPPRAAPPPPPQRPPPRPAPATRTGDGEDDAFSIARPAPLPRDPGGIATEWARRHVGPADPARAVGVCSGCGTKISVSRVRPLRIACPVCGRTRLLT